MPRNVSRTPYENAAARVPPPEKSEDDKVLLIATMSLPLELVQTDGMA